MITFILVPGHNTSKSHDLVTRSNWEELLKSQFPGSEVAVYFSQYDMFNREEVASAIHGLEQLITETTGSIVILSYSFGGFISRLAIQKLSEEDHEKIKALVTMATPFTVPNVRQRKFIDQFSLSKTIDVPILCLAGYLDPHAFPVFMTPVGSMHAVKNFWATHPDFFFSRKVRNKVIREMKKFLPELGIV